MAQPKRVAQHNYRFRRLRPVFFGQKAAAQFHLHAEETEIVAAHNRAGDSIIGAVVSQTDIGIALDGQSGEVCSVGRQIPILGERESVTILENAIQPRSVLDRPGMKRDEIKDCKQAGVQTDCRAQGKQRYKREAGLTPKIVQRVCNVLPDALEPRPDPDRASVFISSRRIAHSPWIATHLLVYQAMNFGLFGELRFSPTLVEEVAEPSQNPHASTFWMAPIMT